MGMIQARLNIKKVTLQMYVSEFSYLISCTRASAYKKKIKKNATYCCATSPPIPLHCTYPNKIVYVCVFVYKLP